MKTILYFLTDSLSLKNVLRRLKKKKKEKKKNDDMTINEREGRLYLLEEILS